MLESYPSALIRRKAKQIKNYSEIRQRTEDARKTANPETGEMERNIKWLEGRQIGQNLCKEIIVWSEMTQTHRG